MMWVFDLDNTLADDAHRVHLIQGVARDKSPEVWAQYFKLCPADKPIVPIANILNVMRWHVHCEIWSGRSDAVRVETERWLSAWVFTGRGPEWNNPRSVGHVPLRMRAAADFRPNVELKRTWAQGSVEKIDLAFEDAVHMTAMWRALGVRCAAIDNREYTQ